jgi:hypothetical protein
MVYTRTESDGTETAWCPQCRRRRKVAEVSTEHAVQQRGEVGYTVWFLECEHQVSEANGDDRPHGKPFEPDLFR